MTVKTKVLSGVITEIVIGTSAGTGYLNGDLITVTGGDANAIFRIVASAGLPTEDESVSFINPPQGEWFPVVVDYVLATNTTVSDLRAGK